jgi:hypothetical protein
MVDLPSNHLCPYLAQHLHSLGSSKCPQHLLIKILKAINHLAHSQWKHRKKYVQKDGKPFEKAALALLDSQILEEFSLCHNSLPPSDQYHFSNCLLSLLSRSREYKKSWYLNVTAAGDQQLWRQAAEDSAHATQAAAQACPRGLHDQQPPCPLDPSWSPQIIFLSFVSLYLNLLGCRSPWCLRSSLCILLPYTPYSDLLLFEGITPYSRIDYSLQHPSSRQRLVLKS